MSREREIPYDRAEAVRPAPMDIHVGSRIRVRRLQQGMSVDRLAQQIGLLRQTVAKVESGRQRLFAGRIHDIGVALDIDPAWFFAEFPGAAAPLSGVAANPILDLMSKSKEGIEMLRAFIRLDPATQKIILGLTEKLAEGRAMPDQADEAA